MKSLSNVNLYLKYFHFPWCIPGKIQIGGGVFQGYRKNRMWKPYGSIKIEVEFQGVVKNTRGVTQFCRIARGEASFCLEFPRVK